VLNGATALPCAAGQGDHVAVVGENRKMLVFPLAELPEMARGKGVRLQKYKDGGLSDAIHFHAGQWPVVERPGRPHPHRNRPDRMAGRRATAGRMAPRGFPRDNSFN
jgi:topoisomerase-4 subunit A